MISNSGNSDQKINIELPNKSQNILIVGDVMLDEHWVTGRQNLSTSSRTGRYHLYVKNGVQENTAFLSGAGRSIIFLKDEVGTMTVLGKWNMEDTDTLLNLILDSKPRVIRNEFRINWKGGIITKRPTSLNLINIMDYMPSEFKDGDFDTTLRMIRIYRSLGYGVDLIERLDFDKRIKENYFLALKKDRLKSELPTDVSTIVFKDLDKELLNKDLIDYVYKVYEKKSVRLCLSTKVWQHDWDDKNFRFYSLRKHLQFLMIPQEAAYAGYKQGDLNYWLCRDAISQEAIYFINGVFKKLPSLQYLVILPNKSQIIAAERIQDSSDCPFSFHLHIQLNPESPFNTVELPMASVFFPAIIKYLFMRSGNDLRTSLENGLQETVAWRKKWFENLTEQKWTDYKGADVADEVNDFVKWSDTSCEEIEKIERNWKDSRSLWKRGIIKEGNIFKVELWRAKTELNGYICLSPWKLERIRNLIRHLEYVKDGKIKRSVVIYVEAEPGSGKTWLVNCLADFLGLQLIDFNISQLKSIDELTDCFDAINTVQSRKSKKPPLIFFDEIDEKINGENVYSKFLAPLEDGYYLRNQRRFNLEPAVWIFVGNELNVNSKLPDFRSRWTIPQINLVEPGLDSVLNEFISICKDNLTSIELYERCIHPDFMEDFFSKNNHKIEDLKAIRARLTDLRENLSKSFGRPMQGQFRGKNEWTFLSAEWKYRQLECLYHSLNFIRYLHKPVDKIERGVLDVFVGMRPTVKPRQIRKFIELITEIRFDVITVESLRNVLYNPENESKVRDLFGGTLDYIKEVKMDIDNCDRQIVSIID